MTGEPAAIPSGESAQARFFESLRQLIFALLAGTTPGVLFLDDLHWSDTASLDLLTYIARRLKDARLLILAAWRSEPGETTQALERLAGELARGGRALRLGLKRLGPDEIKTLVELYLLPGGQPDQSLGQRLYQESEGLPFVAVEYLAALTERRAQVPARTAEGTSGWEMPASVRELLRSRLAGLDAAALQLLSSAAVIGRSFDYHTLREASGRSEVETVDGLDQLLAAGLVVEDSRANQAPSLEIRYDFTHEKLRELVYEETSLARRRLLHRRVADALAHLHPAGADRPGLVAYHYQQAGQDDLAAEYHRLAGEQARRLFANVQAMAHFQAALATGHPDSAGMHESIGDLHTLQGEYNAALASYQTAAALCTPGCLANLEHKLGNVHQRMGNWELAESHYLASLEALGNAPESEFHVHIFADRSLTAHARGDLATAQALAMHALELAAAAGNAHGLAQANNALGILARARNDQSAAVTYLEASLRAAETLDDPLARIAALNNLALVMGEYGRLESAIQLAKQALELCQKRGDRHREAALHNNLADLLHRAGCEEDAMEQLKQAVVIFADIGAKPQDGSAASGIDNGPAAIWKLTEW